MTAHILTFGLGVVLTAVALAVVGYLRRGPDALTLAKAESFKAGVLFGMRAKEVPLAARLQRARLDMEDPDGSKLAESLDRTLDNAPHADAAFPLARR